MAESKRFSLPARPVLPPGSTQIRSRPILAKLQTPKQPHSANYYNPSTTPKVLLPPTLPLSLSNSTTIPSTAFRRGMSDPKLIPSLPQSSSRQTSMRISKKQAKRRRLAYTLSEDLTNTVLVTKLRLVALAAIPRLFLLQCSQARDAASGPDPLISRLAEMAGDDDKVRDLMTRVGAGDADEQELRRFQHLIDRISLEIRFRRRYSCSRFQYS
ncbi:hypothetical protein O1611_g530 [Lasiodiplodia mahajangana]|uniref:Uncharacterized protein n=1 Tax=Lasiodiplodia mahajangana TaxID=1108764 RepID=A0ACC2JZX2_9PEZI|nr:hypothetical protein O1611_g530 [Lasiodiplodia mahajangana]